MENITNQQVGARVAQVRAEMGMTQAELATEMSARLGREIRPLTVTRLEGGKRPIGVDELVAVAEALHVKPQDLLEDKSLPFQSVQILAAHHAVVRASNQLQNAVRQWLSAQSDLHDALDESGDEYLDRLPGFTRVMVDASSGWTVEKIVAEAQNEGDTDDSSET